MTPINYKDCCDKLQKYREKKLGNRFALPSDPPDEWPNAIELCPRTNTLRVVFRSVPSDATVFTDCSELGFDNVIAVPGGFPRPLAGSSAASGSLFDFLLGWLKPPRVRAGARVMNKVTTAIGTGGWFVYLQEGDDRHFLCFGNRHVLGEHCTPVKVGIFPRSTKGKVHRAYPLDYCSNNVCPINHWDLSLAEVPVKRVEPRMEPSDEHIEYPMEISDKLYAGEDYQCVGYGHPGKCLTGEFECVWDGTIPYGENAAYFAGVLRFTQLTEDGDSGALIIRKKDHSATGIAFAKYEGSTYANYLAHLGWTHCDPDPQTKFPVFSVGEDAL